MSKGFLNNGRWGLQKKKKEFFYRCVNRVFVCVRERESERERETERVCDRDCMCECTSIFKDEGCEKHRD